MGTWPSSSLYYCSPSLSVAQSLHLSSETNLVDLEDDLVDLEDDLVDLEETNLVDLEDDLGVVLSVSEMERPTRALLLELVLESLMLLLVFGVGLGVGGAIQTPFGSQTFGQGNAVSVGK